MTFVRFKYNEFLLNSILGGKKKAKHIFIIHSKNNWKNLRYPIQSKNYQSRRRTSRS